jgi:hypothetical protein
MTIAFAVTSVILAAGIVALTLRIIDAHSAERARFAQERWELLTRLTHPEIVVGPPAAERAPAPTPEPDDEYELIGTIQ